MIPIVIPALVGVNTDASRILSIIENENNKIIIIDIIRGIITPQIATSAEMKRFLVLNSISASKENPASKIVLSNPIFPIEVRKLIDDTDNKDQVVGPNINPINIRYNM